MICWAAYWSPVVAGHLGLLPALRRGDVDAIEDIANGLEWYVAALERNQHHISQAMANGVSEALGRAFKGRK